MVGTKYNSVLSTRNLTISELKHLVSVGDSVLTFALLVVVLEQIVSQVEHQLSPYSLVTVHVACRIFQYFLLLNIRIIFTNQFYHRLQGCSFVYIFTDEDISQIIAKNTFSQTTCLSKTWKS